MTGMNSKVRLDIFLSRQGMSASREAARREIIAGWVRVNGETVRQPARLVAGTEAITVERPGGVFVSRGGEKLLKALRHFGINLAGKVAVDLGASTGGFTDCMLREGALMVYAVDVGYGQFDYTLRMDPRVRLMERTNVRDLVPADFDREVDFIAADLSFISIAKVYGNIMALFPGGCGIILIKPQFEAMKGEHKKGVIRKAGTHREVLGRVMTSLTGAGMIVRGLTWSPIRGPKGNIEFLLWFQNRESEGAAGFSGPELERLIDETVEDAHRELDREK